MFTSAVLLALADLVVGSVLWDGRLNNYTDASFLDDWSWSNQNGPYQYYIHGSGSRDKYVTMSASYKNPADTGSNQGLRITIDNTSSWNDQTMMRTELIPQTKAAINAGKVFYHFSMQHTGTNPPSQDEEHQVCFFESHFTEMKYGTSESSSNLLHWYANSESQWNVTFEAGVWHNIAYGIDFDAQTVTFYHSTASDDLVEIAGPISASTSSNGADWHLGVLRLPASGSRGAATEDWLFSGVYIESGDLTKSISGPGNSSTSSSVVARAAFSTLAAMPRQATTFQTIALASNPAFVFTGRLPESTTAAASSFLEVNPAISSFAKALSSVAATLTAPEVAATTTCVPSISG
ncbi:Hypothetical predicted protein [Lecanosticta acicola]|uniref:Glycoside hydrolase 131 catalytic N-terminal domain-containing protein n=1 Tax=Lecanosticta acicola TaxID=111012 RepID=A0AAI8Z8A0_9PEZI|nr:Hypothetical predicted protein [Lecanosticta acicola]